jgi:hypothetical protein
MMAITDLESTAPLVKSQRVPVKTAIIRCLEKSSKGAWCSACVTVTASLIALFVGFFFIILYQVEFGNCCIASNNSAPCPQNTPGLTYCCNPMNTLAIVCNPSYADVGFKLLLSGTGVGTVLIVIGLFSLLICAKMGVRNQS